MSKLPALETFLSERLYNRLIRLADVLDTHPWSRRQIARDADFVSAVRSELRNIADVLYSARQELLFPKEDIDASDKG
jgi:hypothetical protein